MGVQNRQEKEPILMCDNPNQIINLSKFNLKEHHISLLNKGLSFVPTPNTNKFNWVKDTNLFGRKLALNMMHKRKDQKTAKEIGMSYEDFQLHQTLLSLLDEQNPDPKLTDLKPESWFTPNLSEVSSVDLFTQMTTSATESLIIPKIQHDNLTVQQRKALKELNTDQNIIIKSSDNGGNVVIMDREHFIEMCMEHLKDSSAYRKLSNDPTTLYLSELKHILDSALENDIITSEEYKFILPHLTPTIATLYCLPKIHKNMNNPPGRPIVYGNGSITERSSQFLEKLLHPLVISLKSYLQDTKQTLILLENLIVPPYCRLGSLDVS
ncbi:Hypothetical predicted protein [Pelobates cultripes]|uniref:Uncharacterized protein n=1 Tax=Pelobates cultripes TaxID=61616 RepID=A0AAD1S9X4_PELCU|nr:Hypothetical predicted protein [Pelobates cultripes]